MKKMAVKFLTILVCLAFLSTSLIGCSGSGSSVSSIPGITGEKFTSATFEVEVDVNNRTMSFAPSPKNKKIKRQGPNGKVIDDNEIGFKSNSVTWDSVGKILTGNVQIVNYSGSSLNKVRVVCVEILPVSATVTVNNKTSETGWDYFGNNITIYGKSKPYWSVTPDPLTSGSTSDSKEWQFRVGNDANLQDGRFKFKVHVSERPQVTSVSPTSFSVGATVTFYGTNMHSEFLLNSYPNVKIGSNTTFVATLDTTNYSYCTFTAPSGGGSTTAVYYIAYVTSPETGSFDISTFEEVSERYRIP